MASKVVRTPLHTNKPVTAVSKTVGNPGLQTSGGTGVDTRATTGVSQTATGHMPTNVVGGTPTVGANIGNMSTVGGKFNYNPAQASTLDLANFGDTATNRANNQQLIGTLQNEVNGGGPSLAQNQYENNLAQGIASNQAMANSATGGDRGIAVRNAMYSNAMMQQQGARDASTIRMGEQLGAQGQLATAINNGQTQDQNYASTNAGLAQASNIANQNAANAAGQYNQTANYNQAKNNADALNQARISQAQFASGIQQANLGARGAEASAGAYANAMMHGADVNAGVGLAQIAAGNYNADQTRGQTATANRNNLILGGINAAASTGAAAVGAKK